MQYLASRTVSTSTEQQAALNKQLQAAGNQVGWVRGGGGAALSRGLEKKGEMNSWAPDPLLTLTAVKNDNINLSLFPEFIYSGPVLLPCAYCCSY